MNRNVPGRQVHGRAFFTEGTVYAKLRGQKGDEPETIDQGSYHNTS